LDIRRKVQCKTEPRACRETVGCPTVAPPARRRDEVNARALPPLVSALVP
jgi:hypothetical protein